MSAHPNPLRSEEEEWKYAATAMAWHGWGSPIGVGIFLVASATAAALVRLAFWGW
jgi:hypothetical protein